MRRFGFAPVGPDDSAFLRVKIKERGLRTSGNGQIDGKCRLGVPLLDDERYFLHACTPSHLQFRTPAIGHDCNPSDVHTCIDAQLQA